MHRACRSGETARADRREAQCRVTACHFRCRREGQAREHGRRSARDHTRRDAGAGGEPVRDLDQARQGSEHLARLDAVAAGGPATRRQAT